MTSSLYDHFSSAGSERHDLDDVLVCDAGPTRRASARRQQQRLAAGKAHQRAEELKAKATAAVNAAREAESEAKRLADEAKTERKRADRAAKSAEAAGGGS